MIRRLAGMVFRPRPTMVELVRSPRWLDTWIVILLVCAACGAALLSTDVGRQAIVDERVRVVESLGGSVDDALYAAWQADPPWWVYVTSGGRLLLTPAATLLVAAACWAAARTESPRPVRFVQALAVVVHASVVLALGQLVAAPINYVRESLTSPGNLAAILPLVEDGSAPARFFGALDLFTLWWLVLVAIGLAAITGRRARRYVTAFGAVYLGFAAIVAGVIAAVGGT